MEFSIYLQMVNPLCSVFHLFSYIYIYMTNSFKTLRVIGDRAVGYFYSKVIRVCKVFYVSVCMHIYIWSVSMYVYTHT